MRIFFYANLSAKFADKEPETAKTRKRPASEPLPVVLEENADPCSPAKIAPPLAPSLSPLIRNQANFKEEMVNRLQDFESRIMKQMKMQNILTEENKVCSSSFF
jgi:hypothetical protein